MGYIMGFWDNFVRACELKGETPSAVVTAIGLARSSATSWRYKVTTPSIKTKRLLSDYFGLPSSFDWENDDIPVDNSSFYNNFEQKPNVTRIPVLGRVAAGIPIEAITDIDDYEEISPDMAKNGQYIALKIHGHSMEPRMCEGDIIIVRLQNDVESGDIAVVFINGGDATCKKVKKLQDGIMLISTNHEYDTMYYTNKQIKDLPIKILGKVVEIRVKL